MTEKEKIDILIENYKVISEESSNYLTEMMRCFLYAAAVVAIGFGYGEKTENLVTYMPFALLALIIYFLSVGFQYVNANRYKAQIEYKINHLAKEQLIDFELVYKPEISRSGMLPIGKKNNRLLPVPNFLIGVITLVALYFLVKDKKYSTFVMIAGGLFSMMAIYVFIVIPAIIEAYQKRRKWIS